MWFYRCRHGYLCASGMGGPSKRSRVQSKWTTQRRVPHACYRSLESFPWPRNDSLPGGDCKYSYRTLCPVQVDSLNRWYPFGSSAGLGWTLSIHPSGWPWESEGKRHYGLVNLPTNGWLPSVTYLACSCSRQWNSGTTCTWRYASGAQPILGEFSAIQSRDMWH
jgi:hypothetical protein